MTKSISLKRNFVMNSILTMSSFIFPLITFPYVSRILLPLGTGKVSFATSLISYFLMFSQLGIPTYGIRACAKIRDNKEALSKTVHELFVLNLIMSALSYTALATCIFYIPKLREEHTLLTIVSFNIILSAIGVEWLYKALEQYSYITIRSLISKIIALVSMFILIHKQSDYIMYGGISIIASSSSNILNFINVRKYISLKYIGNYSLKKHLKPVFIFFAMACATTIYTNLDSVMLGFMASDIDVGYYNAAVKIKTILVSIVTSLGTVLLPRASYYIEHGMVVQFKQVGRKALTFVFLFATPIMVYFILYAREGIYFLSGEAYSSSILPMQIIMPTLLFIGITNIIGIQILVPLGKEKWVLYSEVAGAVVNLVLNYFLIPRWASVGAAIGTLVAEFIVLIVQYMYVDSDIKSIIKEINYVKIIIIITVISILCCRIKYLMLNSFMTLLISATLYFGLYFVLLLVTKEEIIVDLWRQILNNVKIKFKNILSRGNKV